jgi:hypothetical protein
MAKLIHHKIITLISIPALGRLYNSIKKTTAKARIPRRSRLDIFGIKVLAANTHVAQP